MQNKMKKPLLYLVSVIILFFIWDIFSTVKRLSFALPNVKETLKAFVSAFFTKNFWLIIFSSLVRITEGLIIGVFLGIALSLAVHFWKDGETVMVPFLTVVRATPVVSFILVLWVLLSKNTVPIAIAVLMVTPVVYDQMRLGFQNLDKNKMEILDVFGIKGKRKYRDFVFPTLTPYLFSSLLTSVGLAWKAGISAEIISYTSMSIGQNIHNAKDTFDYPLLFAWTLCAVLLSVLIELAIKILRKKVLKNGNQHI